MSCHCGNNCQPGCGCQLHITLPDNPVEQYTAANLNTLGVGVYDSTEANEFGFRGIYSGNSSIVIALDAGNHAISITLNIDQIVDDLPQATPTQRGVGETATDAETIAKASTTVFLTPSNLAAIPASLTFAGLVELATNAETQAGISSTLAVTPAGLASVIATLSTPTVWADAATRAGDSPDFVGQMGVQQNTFIAWIGSGTGVGDFDIPVFSLDNTNNVMTAATTINLGGQTLTFGLGDFSFFGGIANFDDGTIRFGGATAIDVDFGANANLMISGIQVPAVSMLGTSGAGVPTSRLLDTFLSSANTQTGYTAVTNGAVRRTFDCNTVTLPQLAQAWGTLVEDLKAILLPAT